MARIWNGGAKPVLYSLRVLYFFKSPLSSLRFVQATNTFVCLSSLGNFRTGKYLYQMMVQIQGEEANLSQTSHPFLSHTDQRAGEGG